MRIVVPSLALGLAASLLAVPAVAQEWKADKTNCVAAYGALAHESASIVAWRPQLGGATNLTTIDWAGRRTKLLNGSAVLQAGAQPFEGNFRQMLRKDRIDDISQATGVVIELSMRCDVVFGYSPTFVIPG